MSNIIPTKLNLGSGKTILEDHINVDLTDVYGADYVVDICTPMSSWDTQDSRFGLFNLREHIGRLELIHAHHVLEHFVDLSLAMTNCLNLLTEHGQMNIEVPYELSLGASQDPTHVRFFNENSWLYFTDWCWYLGWTDWRFRLQRQDFVFSHRGIRLFQSGATIEDVLATPRATEVIRVTLQKERKTDGYK